MIEQYSTDETIYTDTGTQFDSKKILYVVMGVVLLVLVMSALFILSSPPEKDEICGNSICESMETCKTCVKDCSCKISQICEKGKCIEKAAQKEVCGNGVCETGESESSCCEDCLCMSEDVSCNHETHKCESKIKYGDGICDVSENCWDHPKDCKCDDGEFCSIDEKVCVKPVCGNSKCEQYENQQNCCNDCKCILPGEYCNEVSNKCEIKSMELSDEDAVKYANDYFEDKGMYAENIEVTGISGYNDEPVKMVKVQVSEGYVLYVGVTESGEIIDMQTT